MFVHYSGYCWKGAVNKYVKYPVLFSTETNTPMEAYNLDWLGWSNWLDDPYPYHYGQLLNRCCFHKVVHNRLIERDASNEFYFLYESGKKTLYIKNVYLHVTKVLKEYIV